MLGDGRKRAGRMQAQCKTQWTPYAGTAGTARHENGHAIDQVTNSDTNSDKQLRAPTNEQWPTTDDRRKQRVAERHTRYDDQSAGTLLRHTLPTLARPGSLQSSGHDRSKPSDPAGWCGGNGASTTRQQKDKTEDAGVWTWPSGCG